MFEHIDFKGGKVDYDDFNIEPTKPFKEQWYKYKEDLFQVSYEADNYIIDIGWYPEGEKRVNLY